MKRLILPIACAALAACVTTSTAAADQTAGLGEIATVNGLSIRPLRVVEDSRCPINARCVWAGRVVLSTEVRSGGGRATYNLVLGEPVDHAGGRLALVAAEPGRIAGSETEPNAYQFTFELTPR